MAKKKLSAAEYLIGSKQSGFAENEPQEFKPFIPGESYVDPVALDEYEKRNKWAEIEDTNDYSAPYFGKFYKGAANDPFAKSIQGENQPWTSKLVNGLVSNAAAVGTKSITMGAEIGGGAWDVISNLAPGVAEARREEYGTALPHLYENIITQGMKFLEEDLIKERLLPVYGGLDYNSDNLLTKMGDMKFWSSDMADSAAFLGAAALTGGAFAKAAKLLGMVVKGAKEGEMVLSTAGKLFAQWGTAIGNTTGEAALEGKEGLDQIREELSGNQFGLSYKQLSDDQKRMVNAEAGKYANNIFRANSAVLLAPNLIQARFFLGPVKTSLPKLVKAVRAGKLSPADISVAKEMAKNAGIGIVSEGLWEEGIQSAVQNYEKSRAAGTSSNKRIPGYIYEWTNNFYNTEGQQAMLLGSIMGMTMGGARGAADAMNERKAVTEYKNKWDKFINEDAKTAEILLPSHVKSPYKTFEKEVKDEATGQVSKVSTILNPKTGKAEWDVEKMMSLFQNDMSNKELFSNLSMASLTGDEVREKYFLNMALGRLFVDYVTNQAFVNSDDAFQALKDRNAISTLAEDQDLKDLGLDFDYMNRKLSQMKQEWDEVQKNLIDKEDLDNNSRTYLKYKEDAERVNFYNRIKLNWLTDIESLVSKKEDLDSMREDSRNIIEMIENKEERKNLYKEYNENYTSAFSYKEKLEEEIKKDPKSLEVKKLRYLNEERKKIFGTNLNYDKFTITSDVPVKYGELGMKNQHYLNLAADAIVGMRLESEIERVKNKTSSLKRVVDILDGPVTGTMETRGKFDITEKDIETVEKLIETDLNNITGRDDYMSEEKYNEALNEVDELQFAEEPIPQEEAEKLRTDIERQFAASKALINEHNDAVARLKEFRTNPEGRGLLNYADNISKLEKDNDIFLRKVADVPVENAEKEVGNFNANKDAYSNIDLINGIINQLKLYKDLYENTDLKTRLDKSSFKGYIESIDKAIKNLEENIIPTVKENHKVSQERDTKFQKNRNTKMLDAMALTVASDGNIITPDDPVSQLSENSPKRKIWNVIKNIVPDSELKNIMNESKQMDQVGDEYVGHEIFVHKIIDLIKKSKHDKEFKEILASTYDESVNNLIDKLKSTTKLYTNIADKYAINPETVFDSLLNEIIGVPDENDSKKTALDIYKLNSDIIELRENILKEENTGYSGKQKDVIVPFIDMHINIESIKELIDLMNSDYNIGEQINSEVKTFKELGIAPTNQQVYALRKISVWLQKKLSSGSSSNKDSHLFRNWFFINGIAGTGKTQIVLKLLKNIRGINANEIQLLAPHDKAKQMLTDQNLSSNEPVLIKDLGTINDNVKYVIVDEIAALKNSDFVSLAKKLYEINSTRKTQLRIIVLGDPNQVSLQEDYNDVTFDPIINSVKIPGMEYMEKSNALTVRHRSLIQEINSFNDIFEGNKTEVTGITVTASKPIGPNALGVHAGNEENLLKSLEANAGSGRSKIIVVSNPLQKEGLKLNESFARFKDSIYTFDEIAGIEEDEVYIYLDRNLFKDVKGYNKAVYTAASRAKQYIYFTDRKNSFKQEYKKEIADEYGDNGKLKAELTRKIDEMKKHYIERLNIENRIINGKAVDLKIEEKERTKQEPGEPVKSKDIPTEDIEDVSDEVVSSESEDDSDTNAGDIGVIITGDGSSYVIKYPSFIGPKRLKTDSEGLRPVIKPGGDVVYVKTIDKTRNNAYTIHILGQLYNAGNLKDPVKNRYVHLGIVSNEELAGDLSGLKTIADSKSFVDLKQNEASGDVTIIGSKQAVENATVGRSKIVYAKPLAYKYNNLNIPTYFGKGFINKLLVYVSRKLYNNEDPYLNYSIKIFSESDLGKKEFEELADKELKLGVPYLLVSGTKKNGEPTRTQFIRLNPTNIKSDNDFIVSIRKLYDSLTAITGIIGNTSSLGDREFNEMIDFFKKNYHVSGENIEFKENVTTWGDYKTRMDDGYLPSITEEQFNRILSSFDANGNKHIDTTIKALYGKGKTRVRIEDQAEMISRYNLDSDLENKDAGLKYEFIPYKTGGGYVIRFDVNDPKGKKEIMYEDGLRLGEGYAQKALNKIAKSNASINDKPIRIKRGRYVKNKDKKEIRFTYTGKSILNTERISEGYYRDLRKIYEENELTFETEWVKDQEGIEYLTPSQPWVTEENYQEAERVLIENGILTTEERDKLKADHTVAPIRIEDLGSIVAFEGDTHSTLRTPLIREQINNYGYSADTINQNRDFLESVLQTDFEDIIPTQLHVEKPSNVEGSIVNKTGRIETREFEIDPEDVDVFKEIKENEGKLLKDTGQELGERITIAKARRMISRRIKGLTNDELEFLTKEALNVKAKDSALGLYLNGIISLRLNEEDNTVYKAVAKHEVFHKIWNEFLSEKERDKAIKQAKKEFKDYNNYESFEEFLAVKYQEYERGTLKKISDFFKYLFEKIKHFIGIYSNNFETINDLFDRIEEGLIDRRLANGDNTNNKMKDIENRFGTVQEYLDCKTLLIIELKKARINGIKGYHATSEEIRQYIYRYFLALEADAIKKLNGELTADDRIKVEDRKNKYSRIISYYDDLYKDLFPGFNAFKDGVYYSNIDEETKAELLNPEKQSVNLSAHINENDRHNVENDLLDEVKEILSYIQVSDKTKKKDQGDKEKHLSGKEDGKFLSWRFVFFKMINLFEGVSLEEGDPIKIIKENYKNNNLTAPEKSIIDFVQGIYDTFTSELNSQNKELSPNYKFIDENTFVYGSNKVEFVKHRSDEVIRNRKDNEVYKKGPNVIKRLEKEHTIDFIDRISKQTKLAKEDVIIYNQKQYYNDIWCKLINAFNSLRQRDPIIGERMVSFGSYEIRYRHAKGNAVTTGIRDRLLSIIDERLPDDSSFTAFMKNKFKPNIDLNGKNNLEFVRQFLRDIGLSQYAETITDYNSAKIASDIKYAFNNLTDNGLWSEKDGDKENLNSETEYIDKTKDKQSEVKTVAYLLNKHNGRLLTELAETISLSDRLNRTLSTTDANKNKRYNAVITSQGHKNIYNLIHTKYKGKTTGLSNMKLFESYTSKFFSNNIFLNGINRIFNIVDYDGLIYDNYSGRERSIEYKNEKREDFNFREFVLGYLSSIQNGKKDEPTYIQYIYPNERKTAFGVEVKVLKREQAISAIESIVRQFKEKDKSLETKVENYAFDKHIGFEIIDEVIGEGSLDDYNTNEEIRNLATEIYLALDEKSIDLANNIIYDETPFDSGITIGESVNKLNKVVDKLIYPNFNVIKLNTNKGGYFSPRQTKEQFDKDYEDTDINHENAWSRGIEKKYMVEAEDILPLVSNYYINNAINRYQFSQLIIGDMAAFKGVNDVVKRISIAFAPGRSGYVNDRYGMNRKSRAMIFDDPVKDNKTIEAFIRSLMPEASDKTIADIIKLYPRKGFKPGDAAGFILPERLEDINKGFGENFGNVLKGVYYNIGKDGIARAFKYASIVLSDELCENNPALSLLREKMRANVKDGIAVEEVIFKTGVKVGIPATLNDWYEFINPENKLDFHPDSEIEIDNRDYRIQLDPEANLDAEVSYPSQLSYILNLYGTNNEIADKIYGALSKIIENNFENYKDYAKGKTTKQLMLNVINKSKQHSLIEILNDNVNIELPALTDKLLVHYISAMFDNSVKTKFSGSKLILQTALGAEKKFKTAGVKLEEEFKRELEFKRDSEGNLYAECIVPEGFLQEEIEENIKKALKSGTEPDNMYWYGTQSKDLLGFRVPSSELHSAVPIKVVGFYDSKKTNVIIAPKMLVVLHGSDFDIDSLFTIKRQLVPSYNKTIPVGYSYDNENSRYNFVESESYVESLKQVDDGDKYKTRILRRKLVEAYYHNMILENFIKAVSSKDNIERMLSPIHLGDADSKSTTDGDLHSEKRRIIEKTGIGSRTLNFYDANDVQEIHDAVFTGDAGIGMFMTMFKAFAFMHRSLKGHPITKLKEELIMPGGKTKEGYSIKFNGKLFNDMTDTDQKGLKSGYRFDSLGNAALDNLKEQILPYINATKETIRAYSVLVMHGIPFETINNFIAQPALRYMTKYGARDLKRISNRLNFLFENDEAFESIELNDEDGLKYLSKSPEIFEQILMQEKHSEDELKLLRYQYKSILEFNKFKEIGNNIAKISRIVNSTRTFPVRINELEDLLGIAREVFGIDEQNDFIPKNINETKNTFPYYIGEFLTVNPHIASALRVMKYLVDNVGARFVLHDNMIKKIAAKAISKTSVQLDYNTSANKKLVRDEFVKFLSTSFVDWTNMSSIEVKKKNKDKTETFRHLTEIRSFNTRFHEMIREAQTKDEAIVNNDFKKGIINEGNIFLKSLSIRKNAKGDEYVYFHVPPAVDQNDYSLYRKAFEDLRTFDFKLINGKYQYITNANTPVGEYTDFQKMFIKYAMLNDGMSLGTRGYSKVLPGAIYRSESDDLVELMKNLNSLNEEQINNLIDAFSIQLILNYPQEAYNNRIKLIGDIKKDSTTETDDAGKEKKIYHGIFDKVYYDLKFSSVEIKEDWPEFHVEKWDEEYTVYKRITEEAGTGALYVRIGKNNYRPQYRLESVQSALSYNMREQFEKKLTELKLRNVKGIITKAGTLETYATDLAKGMKVNVSSYDDPGAMYSKIYVIKEKIGENRYKLKADNKYKASNAFGPDSPVVDKVYNGLIKELRSKAAPTHPWSGRILVKKHEYGNAQRYCKAINDKRFGGLKVVYMQQTGAGTEIMVNRDLLGQYIYGRQLDMFTNKYEGEDIGNSIINEVQTSNEVKNLAGAIFSIDITTDNRINEIARAYNNKTPLELLDGIESRVTNKFTLQVIKWIRPLIKSRTDMVFKGHEVNQRGGAGLFNPLTGELTLDYIKLASINASQRDIDRVVLHELVHAISTVKLYEDAAFRNEVLKYIDHIKKHRPGIVKQFKRSFRENDPSKPNGSEFIAEFFSNPNFHDALSEVVYEDENGVKTILDRIIDWVMNIISKIRNNKTSTDQFEKWLYKNVEALPYYTLDESGNIINYKGEKSEYVNSLIENDVSVAFSVDDTKTLKNIVDQGSDLSKEKDENGMEAGAYTNSEGNTFRRISDVKEGWMSFFRKSGKTLTFGERKANEEWGDVPHDVKREVDSKEMSYDEYKESMDKISLTSEVRGRIIHMLDQIITDKLYNNGRMEVELKSEIQKMAYGTYTITDSTGKTYSIDMSEDPSQYSWYLEEAKDIYRAHNINALNTDIPADMRDIMASEVPISLKELGFAGTADKVIEHSDGTISIKDLATGVNFDRFKTTRIFKYGYQNTSVYDNARDRKKMQVMMYAFMIKANNPDVRFRDLSIMWVPNKYNATNGDPLRKVEVDDYLNMIKAFLKDEKALKEAGIDTDVYKKLIEKSPRLFDVSEYTWEYEKKIDSVGPIHEYYQDRVISQLISDDKSPAEQANRLLIELQRIIGKAKVDISKGKNDYSKLNEKDKVHVKEITGRLLQLLQDSETSLTVDDQHDVSLITRVLGNYSDMSAPQIQTWLKFRNNQEMKYSYELDKLQNTHKAKYRAVLDEYMQSNPRLLRNKKLMDYVNYKKMFAFAYKEFDNNGDKQLRLKHRDLDGKEFESLTKAQRDYLDYLNNHYKSYFDGADAYANSISTYVPQRNGTLEEISVIDLYNKELGENQKFRYYKGWFPKTPKDESEVVFEAGEGNYLKGLFDKKFIGNLLYKSLTYYFENAYYGRNHAAMVLPLKYMGSRNIDNSREYTYNLEHQFDKFTTSIEYKKHFDPVYAFGEGVRAYLDMERDQPMYARTLKMFEDKLTSDVLGRTIRQPIVRRSIRIPFKFYNKDIEEQEIRADAIFMLMRNWTSATLMWLKPFTGGGNGINAALLQHKDSLKGTISAKVFGVEQDAIDTTLADSLFGDKVYFSEHLVNQMRGKLEQDKTWLLLKKLRYLPDNFDYMTNEKYLLSPQNKMIKNSGMYMFHRIPEEFTSIVTMVSQLHHLKHPTEVDPTTGKPKSLWDCYKVVQLENGEYDVEWNAAPRGLKKTGRGPVATYEKITELTGEEVAKIKKVYERLQGGYRKSEATAIEAYVMGKMFIQLKKYYPRLLLNAFSSKREEVDLGYFKKTLEKKDGEDVYVWMKRHNEGRFWIMGKYLLATMSMGKFYDQYKWNALPPEYKQHLVDAAVTLGMVGMTYTAYLKMFDDDKDDDSLKMWWKMYMVDNFIQQYSPKELMKIGVQSLQPVAFTRALDAVSSLGTAMGASWQYTFGDREKAFTREDDFRGWNNLRKSIPLMASYYDFIKRVENSEDITKVLQIDQFSKWR